MAALPVFNLADAAIVGSVVGIVALTLLGFELDGHRHGWAARHHPPDPEPGDGPEAARLPPREPADEAGEA